jgi:uncharacterized membrane protein
VSGRVLVGGLIAVVVIGLVHPIAGAVLLALLGLGFFLLRPQEGEAPAGGEREAGRGDSGLEARVARLEQELAELRLFVATSPVTRTAPAAPAHPPRPQPTVARPPDPAPPLRPDATAPSRPRPAPARPRRELDLDLSRLLGALGLAWAGGIVTVLGIVFFFVLAVNRGWINAELRLAFGAAASVAVFSAGFWLRQRFGTTYAALAAVGAGIAGGFATLLAASGFYDFVPDVWALVAAAGIAAAATAVAIAWSAELVAGLGLVGALLVPFMALFEKDELTVVGTGFVAIVYAATALVAFDRGWRYLLLAGLGASFPQFALLAAQSEPTDWTVVALTAVYWALLLATAAVLQVREGSSRLEPLAATVVLVGAVLACGVSAHLFDGERWDVSREGLALLAVAAAHLALGAAFFRRLRDFSSLLWAVGLAVLAVAVAELLGGGWLALAWAGEAAVLAWLGEATRERRFQLSAVAYLGLALGYTLAREAPLTDLFRLTSHPAEGAPSVLAVAAAAAALAWFVRAALERSSEEGPVATFVADLVAVVRRGRDVYLWLSGTLVAYAASLGLLELFLWVEVDGRATRFERGHVAVSALWAAIGLALVEVGMRRRRLALAVGGLAWTAAAVLKTVTYDEAELGSTRAAIAFLLVGAGALLAGFEYQRLGARRWRWLRVEVALAIVLSAGLGAAGVVQLADGTWNSIDVTGGALVLLALPYAALSALVFRTQFLRNLATLLWAIALVVVGAALFLLLDDVWLVLALALASALLSPLALAVREIRFQAASAVYLLVALGYTLALEAPPRDFFWAAQHPGDGVPALVLVALAGVVFAVCARHEIPAERAFFSWSEPITLAGLTDALRSWQPAYRAIGFVGAAVLGLYALSLGILDAAERFSGASVATDFQRGHTAVSAVWGAVGLALLTLGLLRRSRGLRFAGFALFGLSLAKLFLYDLTTLSSLARALSFLAVGALLLLGGFFYQRLSERLEERGPAGSTAG